MFLKKNLRMLFKIMTCQIVLNKMLAKLLILSPQLKKKCETTKIQNGADNESKDSGGQKRMRQPSLFESFGKLSQFENQIGDLITEIQDKEQQIYL